MRVTTTTRIACPPEDVFDLLADLRNDVQWNGRVSRAELRSSEPIGLGSRFAIVNGGSPYEVTITGYERPSRLVLEASGQPDLTIAYGGDHEIELAVTVRVAERDADRALAGSTAGCGRTAERRAEQHWRRRSRALRARARRRVLRVASRRAPPRPRATILR